MAKHSYSIPMMLVYATVVIVAGSVPSRVLAAPLIQPRGLAAAGGAAPAFSDRRSCAIAKGTLTVSNVVFDDDPFKDIHFAKDGIVLDFGKNKRMMLAYANIAGADIESRRNENRLVLHMRDNKTHHFTFADAMPNQDQRGPELQRALMTLSEDASKGASFLCSDDPADYATELAVFQRDTAAWRALPVKPAIADEAYKDRLLAEDALKGRDMNAALKFYEDGIAASATWDQGWYNAALIYAEMGDNFDAAVCMKHYVALMPDAPDARAARDNIILWDTKAASSTATAVAAPPAPTRRRK